MAVLISTTSLAGGYTGNEVQVTSVLFDDFQSTVVQYRRYHKGFFVDVELFDSQETNVGVGYQYGDLNTIVDLRVNENNTKLYILQRF